MEATTALNVEWIKVSDLHPNPANPRLNDAAVGPVADSIRRFGWQQPIVAKPDGEIIAGHTRFRAAQKLGEKRIPVLRFTGSDLDAVAFGIADNKTATFSDWDEPALAKLLAHLQAEDAIEGVGFTDDEIEALKRAARGESEDLEDGGCIEPIENPVVTEGDLWILGGHRILCGDSTLSASWDRLLAGAEPTLCVTDPPYGVNYDASWRAEQFGGKGVKAGKVLNDDQADWSSVWAHVPSDVIYCWHAGVMASTVQLSLGSAGFEVRSQIIWRKTHMPISRGHYHWRHEPCWYAVRKGSTAHWIGDRKQSTVWELGLDKIEGAHSTPKPVEAMGRPMRNHNAKEVCDPFLGSGTTLIAAEQLDRTCFALELNPAYVEAAILRWEKLTGEEARREDSATLKILGREADHALS